MKYFDTLPKIVQTDSNGISKVMTNLMARVSIIPQILNNPSLYYQYDIQEGDTPEIIAHKYYGDSYRYWIVLFANEILDPQWNWPVSGSVFNEYLLKKYPNTNLNNFHNFEKIITTTDHGTNTTTTQKVVIGDDEYNSMIPGTKTFTLPTGDVTVTIDRNIVSIYDYEYALNESKRNIKILNSTYVNELETEFSKLMAS